MHNTRAQVITLSSSSDEEAPSEPAGHGPGAGRQQAERTAGRPGGAGSRATAAAPLSITRLLVCSRDPVVSREYPAVGPPAAPAPEEAAAFTKNKRREADPSFKPKAATEDDSGTAAAGAALEKAPEKAAKGKGRGRDDRIKHEMSVFVKNLAISVTEDALLQYFITAVGPVNKCAFNPTPSIFSCTLTQERAQGQVGARFGGWLDQVRLC